MQLIRHTRRVGTPPASSGSQAHASHPTNGTFQRGSFDLCPPGTHTHSSRNAATCKHSSKFQRLVRNVLRNRADYSPRKHNHFWSLCRKRAEEQRLGDGAVIMFARRFAERQPVTSAAPKRRRRLPTGTLAHRTRCGLNV